LRIGFLIVSLLVLQFFYQCKSNSSNEPIVQSESITINKDLFKKQKIWSLNGQWKFRLLEKDKVKVETTLPVPDKWQNHIPESESSNRDIIGEYSITIFNEVPGTAILIPFQKHSQESYIDNILIQSSMDEYGNFSNNFFPSPTLLPLGKSTLTIKISNREGNHTRSGIRFPIKIGNIRDLTQDTMSNHFINYFLGCFILGVGLYHLLFYINYREDMIQFYFSLFCISVSLYSLIISNEFENILPFFKPDYHIRIEFFLEIFFFVIFSRFLDSLFTELTIFTLEKYIRIVAYYMLVIIILLDIHNLSIVYSYSNYAFFLLGAEAFFKFLRAYKNNLKDSKALLLLGTILIIFMVNDIIYGISDRFFIVPYSFPYGLIFFIIAYSYLISKHFTEALKKEKELSVLQIKYNEQIIHYSNQKMKIAGELHDKIGADLSYLVLEANRLKEQFPEFKDLNLSLKSALESIRDYVYILTSEKDNHQILEEEIGKYLLRLKSSKMIEVDYKLIDISKFLSMDESLHLQRIFSEVMTNVMRHSKPKSLHFFLFKKKTYLGFLILHDGKPFRWRSWLNSRYSGMGLSSIKDRLRKIKGRGKLFRKNQGNVIIISKKLNLNH
jgi:signal transduction histidine kinase